MHSDVLGVVRVSDCVSERPSSFCTLVNIGYLCNHEIIVSLLTLSLDPVPCIGTIPRGDATLVFHISSCPSRYFDERSSSDYDPWPQCGANRAVRAIQDIHAIQSTDHVSNPAKSQPSLYQRTTV